MPLMIRLIQQTDNPETARIIREVLTEFEVPKKGSVYEDISLDTMFEAYDKPRHAYFILEENGKILGGAGIAPLKNSDENICELQKMYFSAEGRNRGWGEKMMQTCLQFSKQNGYSGCYLETLPFMKDARKLYEKSGFKNFGAPLGNTGHFACNVWMFLKFPENRTK